MKSGKIFRTRKEELKRENEISKYKHTCKCGHVVIISNSNKTLCTHCGNWVFKNPAEEFKYRMMEKMGKKFE